MEALASTIAELLSMNGVCLVLYNHRSDVEAALLGRAPRFNLRRRADSRHGIALDDLGFAPRRVDGLKLRTPWGARTPRRLRQFAADSRVAADDARRMGGLIFLLQCIFWLGGKTLGTKNGLASRSRGGCVTWTKPGHVRGP